MPAKEPTPVVRFMFLQRRTLMIGSSGKLIVLQVGEVEELNVCFKRSYGIWFVAVANGVCFTCSWRVLIKPD